MRPNVLKPPLNYPFSTRPSQLTLTNVINDAADATNLLHLQQGTWIGPAVTNLTANPNAATNTTGITDHSSTTSRVTTGVTAFAGTAFEVVSGNAAANEGPSQSITGGASATAYTVSAWAWLISGAATVRATLSDTVAGKQGGTPVVLTATPQKITVSATTGAASGAFASYVETTVQQAGTWRIGGWQTETGSVANPVALSGSRSAGRVQVPWDAGLFTQQQGWMVGCISTGWATATNLPAAPIIAEWSDPTHIVNQLADYRASSTQWKTDAVWNSTTTSTTNTADSGYALAAYAMVANSWTPAALRISADGAVAVSSTRNGSPGGTAFQTFIDVGSRLGTSLWVTSNYIWFACGSGPLTDANSAQLYSVFGKSTSRKPTFRDLVQLIPNAHPTLLWDGRSGTAQRRVAA